MKNATKFYFVSANDIHTAVNGRYGFYARLNGFSYSEKAMSKLGYELRSLTRDEVDSITAEIESRLQRMRDQREAMENERRMKQVETCLSGEPLTLCEGKSIVDLEGAHLDAYTGCGRAIAYINNGQLMAWHYGETVVANAPECDIVQPCEASCCQLIF